MLENTFIHLPKFGEKKERALWENGVKNWNDYIDNFSNSEVHAEHCNIINSSIDALKNKNAEYFGNTLPKREAWRAFPYFNKIAYLDIETTGISKHRDYTTVIGLFDGNKMHSYVHGKNLDQFSQDIEQYEMVVTFNGSLFDIPFIKRDIPEAKVPSLHVDTRFLLSSLGVKGGLKKIEAQFGLERENDLKGMNGYDAVILWKKYKKNNDLEALDKLVRYNAADVENLKTLLEWGYKKKRGEIGIE